jgi:hypothetical protein
VGTSINFNVEFSDEEDELYSDLHNVIVDHIRKTHIDNGGKGFSRDSLIWVLSVLSARQLAFQFRDYNDQEILEEKNKFNLHFTTNFERAIMQEKEI